MGIREELLPANYEESEKLYHAIRAHQGGASEAGRALAAALLNLLEQLMPPGDAAPAGHSHALPDWQRSSGDARAAPGAVPRPCRSSGACSACGAGSC